MDRHRVFRSVIACMLTAACGRAGTVQANGPDPPVEQIDRYVAGRMRAARIPGLALAIVKRDRAVYVQAYGVADPTGRPVTPDTPFEIGSITKAVTALAVMQLVEARRVQLDAPVQRYLPWFRVADAAASARISVRQLLTMTSGLPQLYEPQLWTAQDDGVVERAVRLLANADLARPVGSFGYANANFEALGLIVQAASGLTYEDYVRQNIFAPLGMRSSFLSLEEAQRHGMASGYRWWFGVPIAIALPFNRAELPAGYIVSSARDMSHFLIAEMNGGRYGGRSVLSADGTTLTHTEPAPRTYAMGWESIEANGRTLINDDGGTASFQSSLFFDPEARVGVFIAANVINALDAFSSPSGSAAVDGATVRAMAQSVLSLATNHPLPSQGRRHERLTLIFDVVLLVLTGALACWLRQAGIRHRRHPVAAAVLGFALPAAVLCVALAVPAWKAFFLFEPDFGYWLYAAAAALFIKGLTDFAAAGGRGAANESGV